MSKIQNPVVIIHKRENSDTYAVAITSGSSDYRDAVLMATMEPDMTGDTVDTWSKTGYYMAAEIERLRVHMQPDYPKLLPCAVELKPGLIIGKGCKTETLLTALQRRDDYYAEIDAMTPEERMKRDASIEAFKAMLPSVSSVAATAKTLTINLPDTSSKAFWSGTGKSEVFHPQTYHRWVKEAIEHSCVIAGIEVKVK